MMDRTTITLPVLMLIFLEHIVSSTTEWYMYQSYPNRSLAVVTSQVWVHNPTVCCLQCTHTDGCKAVEFSAGNGACKLSDRDPVHANPSDMVASTASTVFVQDSVANPPCPYGWVQWGESCYFQIPQSQSFLASKQQCIDSSANLVYIDSMEEHDFVWETFGATGGIWIGLDAPLIGSPPAVWTNGQAVTFENYYPDEPSDGGFLLACVKADGRWLSDECINGRPSVCKMPVQ